MMMMNADTGMAMAAGATLLVIGGLVGASLLDRENPDFCPDTQTNPWFPVKGSDQRYIRNFVEPECWTPELAAEYQAQLDEFVGDRRYYSYVSRSLNGKYITLRVVITE